MRLMKRLTFVIVITCGLQLPGHAAEEFSFDLSSYDKKPYEFAGYAELVLDRQKLNQDGAAYLLSSFANTNRSTLDRQASTIELSGQYQKNAWQFNFNAHAFAERDNTSTFNETKIYEGIVAYKPQPGFTFELGKKAMKWGKGYAWNPVAFVERPKNPDDPDQSRQGYNMVTLDMIKSFQGDLKTTAFTPVYLPVTESINNDFGGLDEHNFAAKLYLLYNDTDIDITYLSEGSRSYRYGFDFARNITTNFEVHGEWAYLSSISKTIVDTSGNTRTEQDSAMQWLLGLRYLTENETTIIAEYYRNEAGYSKQEMADFFTAVDTAYTTANMTLLNQLALLSQQSYLKRNPGKAYLYLRMSNKEPFDWLYFIPAITIISNLEDQSYSISPELIYTGITNLEVRTKLSWLSGKPLSEFAEKRNQQKIEFRLRYYF